MRPENESEMIAEIEKVVGYLFWHIRNITGQFPTKIRIDCFFGSGTSSHFTETERRIEDWQLSDYEEAFQKYLKVEAIEQAKRIIKDDKSIQE